MFDRYVGAKTQRSTRSKGLFFGASALAHGAGIAALLTWSFWKIEKVAAKNVPVSFFVEMKPPAAPPEPPPPPPPAAVLPLKPKSNPPTQPTRTATPDPDPDPDPDRDPDPGSDPDPDPVPGPSASGDPDGVRGGTGTGDGKCTTPPCASEPVPGPVIADLSAVEAQRVSGNRNILLPAEVKQALHAQGARGTSAAVRLCLSTAGAPTQVQIVRSTGFAAADARIRDEMSAWRYRPYTVNGRAQAVCTSVVFNYRLE